jgi:hypothetical protein
MKFSIRMENVSFRIHVAAVALALGSPIADLRRVIGSGNLDQGKSAETANSSPARISGDTVLASPEPGN